MRIKRAPRGVAAVALTALALALCVAACGSSSSAPTATRAASTSTTATGTTPARNAAFTTCLKQHGVTLPARRGGFRGGHGGFFGGGGGAPGTGTGTTPQGTGTALPPGQGPPNGGGFFRGGGRNPKFAKAFQACSKDLPAGFRGRFGPGAGRRGFGRAHFQTTTLNKFVACVKQHGYTLPKPNTSGSGPVFPRSIEADKQFQVAAKSCESILTSGFRGTRPGGATGTSTTSGA